MTARRVSHLVGICGIRGGESVLVNGAVFKTVSETVRTGSGRFDSYTPPPDCGGICESGGA